jgi:hypothetical protein
MAITLDHSQRDGVHQFVLHDLGNLGELALALGQGEVHRAQDLRKRFEEDLRLLDEIGWEKKADRNEYLVRMDFDELRSVFTRLRELTTEVINEAMTEFANQMLKEAFSVGETCAVVLGQLPGGARPRS